jgi:hypothetical protein
MAFGRFDVLDIRGQIRGSDSKERGIVYNLIAHMGALQSGKGGGGIRPLFHV